MQPIFVKACSPVVCGSAGNQLQAVGRADLEVLRACQVLDLGGNHSLALQATDMLDFDHVLETVCLARRRTLPAEFMEVGAVMGACNARRRAQGRCEVEFENEFRADFDQDGINTQHWNLGLSNDHWGTLCHFDSIIDGDYDR